MSSRLDVSVEVLPRKAGVRLAFTKRLWHRIPQHPADLAFDDFGSCQLRHATRKEAAKTIVEQFFPLFSWNEER